MTSCQLTVDSDLVRSDRAFPPDVPAAQAVRRMQEAVLGFSLDVAG